MQPISATLFSSSILNNHPHHLWEVGLVARILLQWSHNHKIWQAACGSGGAGGPWNCAPAAKSMALISRSDWSLTSLLEKCAAGRGSVPIYVLSV